MNLTLKPRPLNKPEKILLDKYFVFASALEKGSFSPRNEKERYFIKVCQGKAPPKTTFQEVYLKYIQIRDYNQRAERERSKINKEITLKVMKIEGDVKSQGNNGLKENEGIDLQKRKELSEAIMQMAERNNDRGKYLPGTNIPLFEEGTPRSEFGTREDHKRMRARDWGDTVRGHK